MIQDGCLDDGPQGPYVDFIYGLHLWSCEWSYSARVSHLIFSSDGALGQIGCKHGPCMACSDRFEIDVRGLGGHGAHPNGNG